MDIIKISSDREHFTRGGKPFFWVGDTVWSAFTNAREDEWEKYLEYRRNQGFNVLQINSLPQWDRIQPDLGIYPYPMRADGSMDFDSPVNSGYTDHVRRMCSMAAEKGFSLAIVVCWANFVPGTWLADSFPSHVWPIEAAEKHVKWAAETFREFCPVYFISGDANLNNNDTVEYYRRIAEALKTEAPESLLTLHMLSGAVEIPEELADTVDFCVVQSGHWAHTQNDIERLIQSMKNRYPDRPLLNAEPCYECMPKLRAPEDDGPAEVFSAEEVVDACRKSIMAGADAGITYGANGLWNWCREGGKAEGLAAELYSQPLLWHEAMKLPGSERIAKLEGMLNDR